MEEKQVKTTLEGVLLTDKRADGNTTRQIDAAIQYLFKGYKVKCIAYEGSDYDSNRFLANKIIDRLDAEHSHIGYCHNLKENTIEL